jgi:hypothetical protein
MPKKLLISACTHGDEQVGKYIFEKCPYGENQNYTYRTCLHLPTFQSPQNEPNGTKSYLCF